ncbi:hypothetical protein LY78DRAFT_738179 [Colletotrichum sublineola]|nr:hypothetical protein LY78DRAFT_738179 [Colletotrichum sublineola]
MWEYQECGQKHMDDIMLQLVQDLEKIKSNKTEEEINTAIEKGREIQRYEQSFGFPNLVRSKNEDEDEKNQYPMTRRINSPSAQVVANKKKRSASRAELENTGKDPVAKRLFRHHHSDNRYLSLLVKDLANNVNEEQTYIYQKPGKDFVGVQLNGHFAIEYAADQDASNTLTQSEKSKHRNAGCFSLTSLNSICTHVRATFLVILRAPVTADTLNPANHADYESIHIAFKNGKVSYTTL